MRLVPFDSSAASQIQEWNLDPDYSRFWIGCKEYLTLDQCSNLNIHFGCEFLLLADETKLFGLVVLKEESRGISIGILIDKKYQGLKLGAEGTKLIEDYCFKVKHARTIKTECSLADKASNSILSKSFILVGMLPKYSMIQDSFEDVNLYYKINPLWDIT